MTDTNRLLSLPASDVTGADLLRLWAQKYGADVGLSLTNLKEWLDLPGVELTTQYAAPSATGFSVAVSAVNTWLILTPGAAYAAGTVTLPQGSDKAEVLVNCTQAVTALTVTPASGESVIGAPATLAANDFFRLRFDAVVGAWYRVG